MNKQGLSQKLEQKIGLRQIQFLNILQLPISEINERINEEMENNPVLEQEETKELDELEGVNQHKHYVKKNTNSHQIASYNQAENNLSLSEYLKQQLVGLDISERENFLSKYIIDSLGEDGLLSLNLITIQNDLLINSDLDVGVLELESALKVVQNFEPFGVAAKNLQECLLIQLKKKFSGDCVAQNVIENHYIDFCNKNYERLCEKLNISNNDLKKIYEKVETLNPRPGNGFSKNTSAEYVYPDFILMVKNGVLELTINKAEKSLKINSYYVNMLKESGDVETRSFLQKQIDRGEWFKEMIERREKTLKNIMDIIINHQKEYFISGSEKLLKPMKLADIASKAKLDISTISRFSNSKYIEAHFGTFKIKELFSEAYRKIDGEVISTNEIKSEIKKIIEAEDKKNPLTDKEITSILSKNDYHIARRTVTKYREQVGIQKSKIRRLL